MVPQGHSLFKFSIFAHHAAEYFEATSFSVSTCMRSHKYASYGNISQFPLSRFLTLLCRGARCFWTKMVTCVALATQKGHTCGNHRQEPSIILVYVLCLKHRRLQISLHFTKAPWALSTADDDCEARGRTIEILAHAVGNLAGVTPCSVLMCDLPRRSSGKKYDVMRRHLLAWLCYPRQSSLILFYPSPPSRD